jgi:hypothetical protein
VNGKKAEISLPKKWQRFPSAKQDSGLSVFPERARHDSRVRPPPPHPNPQAFGRSFTWMVDPLASMKLLMFFQGASDTPARTHAIWADTSFVGI